MRGKGSRNKVPVGELPRKKVIPILWTFWHKEEFRIHFGQRVKRNRKNSVQMWLKGLKGKCVLRGEENYRNTDSANILAEEEREVATPCVDVCQAAVVRYSLHLPPPHLILQKLAESFVNVGVACIEGMDPPTAHWKGLRPQAVPSYHLQTCCTGPSKRPCMEVHQRAKTAHE